MLIAYLAKKLTFARVGPNTFEQAELILQAALDPCVAHRARKGEFVTCFDHFDLLQTPIN
jgi:hypothetical protein